MSDDRKDLPPVNAPNFLEKVREVLSTYLGNRGSALDRGVTLRDLTDAGVVELSALYLANRRGSPVSGVGSSVTDAINNAAYAADLTAPPTPTGFTATAGLTHVFVNHDAPTYTQGHGHARTLLYGSTLATPVFADAVLLGEFLGNVYAFPSNLGTAWHLWIKWESVDGVASTVPAGGTNGATATTGKIGNTDLGPLIIEAGNLADGSVAASKLAAQAVTLTSFANGIEPVTIVTGSVAPTSKATNSIFLTGTGKLYRWDGSAYTAAVAAGDLSGQLVTAQIADAALTTAKFAAGIRPVEVVATLPATGNTAGRIVFLTTDNKLYRYNGSAWVASVASSDISGTITDAQVAGLAASKVTGQLTNSQIADLAAAKLTGQVVASQITDAAITTAKFASGIEPLTVVSGVLPTSKSTNAIFRTDDQKVYRWSGTAYVATVLTSDLSGTVADAQIAGLAASKVTGQLTNSQIADLAAAKLTGTIANAQIADGSVSGTKFASGIEPVSVVSSVPGTKSTSTVFNTTDGKLYRWNGSAYVASVPSGDISGTLSAAQIASVTAAQVTGQLTNSQIADVAAAKVTGQIVSSQVADAAITTAKFATGIEPVTVVSAVPGTKSTNSIFNTTDGKLYRWNGTAYVASVASTDISGTLAAAQIASLAASQITGQLSDTQLAAISASKISGQLTNTQIADLAATKISGQLTDTQLAAIGAAKVTGQLTASQLNVSIGGGNLLPNASFEIDTNSDGLADNWGLYAAANTPSISVDFQHGAKSQRFLADGGPTPRTYLIANRPKLVSGQQYTLSAWVKTTAQVFLGYKTFSATAAGTESNQGNAVSVAGTGAYQRVRLSFTAPNSDWISPMVGATNTPVVGTEVLVDSVQLELGDLATAFAPKPDEILPGTVTATEISDNAITTPKLITGAITTAKIATGAVTASEIAAGAITTTKLAAAAVTANEIAAGAVTAGKIAANAVTATEISAGSITTAKIASGAVTASEIAAGSITTAKIAAGAITSNEIAANTITAADIAAGTLTATEIASGAITTAKLAAGAVTANEIAASTITGAKIAAGTITGSNIAADTITAGQIAAGAVTASEIATNAVTTGKLLVTGVGAAINDDPGCIDQSAWTGWGGNSAATVTAITDGKVGSSVLRATSSTRSINAKMVPADPGKTYRLSAWVRQQGNGLLYLRTVDYGPAETAVSGGLERTYSGLEAVSPPSGVWTRYSTQFTIPSGRAFITPHILLAWGGTTGYMEAQDVRIEEAVPADLIVDGAISTTKLTANAVTTAKLAAGAVTASEIATDAVTAVKIQAGAITTAKIAAGAVTASEIAANTITTGKMAAGAITATELAAGAVTAGKIAANAVTATEIAAGSITTAKIATDAVTANEIAANAITAAEIAAGAVTTAKIAAGAVTANEIAAATITGGKIAAGTITGSNIAADTITAGQIAAGAVTASEVAAGAISVQKLLVTPVSLCPDPFFDDQAWWGGTLLDANGWFFETGAALGAKTRASLWSGHPTNAPGTSRKHIWSAGLTPPAAGTVLRLRCRALNSSNQAAHLVVRFSSSGGADLLDIFIDFAAGASTATDYSVQGTVPADAAVMRFIIYNDGVTTFTGVASITGVMLDVAASADLVVDGAITTAKLTANAVTTAKLAAGAVTANEIAADAVTAVKIQAGAITTAKIAAGAVTANEISASTITGAKIAAGTITASNIATDTITAGQIAAGAIGASEIAASAVTTAKLAAGAVTANEIAAATITGAQIAAGTITASNIATGTITAGQIAAGAIGATEIAAGAITTTKLAANSIAVGTAAIQNGAIVNAMLGDATITSVKIADATITAAKITDATITAAKIADATLIAPKLADATIINSKIADSAITNAKIGGSIYSTDYYTSGTTTGWFLDRSGNLIANNGVFRGSLNGASITGATGEFSGTLRAGVVDLSSSLGITTDYLTPGTYTLTVPAGKTSMRVSLVGGGGGGGGGSSRYYMHPVYGGGGGGGGGGYVTAVYSNLTPGATYSLTVGAGGAAGSASDGTYSTGSSGSAGGATFITGVISAAGGGGGASAYAGGAPGAAGGTSATAGGYAQAVTQGGYTGGGDNPVYTVSVVSWDGGMGGNALWGVGGLGGIGQTNTVATSGSGYGAGGGGGGGNMANNYLGFTPAAGRPGKATIEFFDPNGVVLRTEYSGLTAALVRQNIQII